MITRRSLPALALILATGLLLAAPAAAQSDPVTSAMVSTMDLCLRVLQGQASWQSGLDSLGYRTVSTGGRVLPVGSSVVAATLGSNTVRGASARVCEITASPALASKSALKAAMAARAGSLPPMGEGPISGGGVMDGYADLNRSGLAVLAVTDRPASGGNPATTSLSVIWK